MKRYFAVLGAVAIFASAATAVAAPGGRGSGRSSPRGQVRSQPASRGNVRSYAAPRAPARSYAAPRASVRSYAAPRAGNRGYSVRPHARVRNWAPRRVVRTQRYYGRAMRPAVYRTSYPAAYAPAVSTTTWCADPIVPDAWGRAVCSTNGALLVDSSGAVIYLSAGNASTF